MAKTYLNNKESVSSGKTYLDNTARQSTGRTYLNKQQQAPQQQRVQYAQPNYKENVPNWLRSVDTGLRKFSQGADNAPKFSFADKIQNPVGKFAASIPQTLLNIPSNVADVALRGYGQEHTAKDYLKRGAEAAEVGLDVGSFFGGGPVVKQLLEQGAKEAGLKQLVKQGFKTGVKQGAGYGAGYGGLGAIQNDENVLAGTAQGALGGALFGGALGGASPVAGRMFSRVLPKKKELILGDFKKKPVDPYKVVGELKTTGETKPVIKFSETGQVKGQQDIFGNKFGDKNVNIKFKGTEKSKIPVKVKKNDFEMMSDALDIDKMKDINNLDKGFKDVYRVFQKVFGKQYDKVKKTVLDPFDKSKGNLVKEQQGWLNELKSVTEKLGVKKGSKKSAAIQQFGEKKTDYSQLVKDFGKKEANEIVEADKWFRKSYDTLLDDVNRVRARIYPGNPDKQIPKRADYYRHFQEMAEGFSGLKNIFDSPAGISSQLAGVSATTKPKSKWLSFAQKRLGDKTDEDAVGGFLNYLQAAQYAKHIDPHTANFRKLEQDLVKKLTGTPYDGKLSNFQSFLTNFANDLAGKTNPLDRGLQEFTGRKVFSALNWTNNRVKANVILGNASSSIAQIFNVPQGMANAGINNSKKGLGRTFASIFKKNSPMAKSDFIKERFFKGFGEFDKGLLNKPKKFAVWMLTALDEAGTKFIWNSHYEKALSEGIKNPIKYADDITREMVAGRGIGEVPLIQKSKVFQLAAPFQLEVTNIWHVMNKWAGEKAANKFAQFFVYSYIFNRVAEKVRGNSVSFDPIEAMIDAYGTLNDGEDNAWLRAGGRLAGEVLSNMPGGQTIAAAYPEYGAKPFGMELPTREALFGSEDPTRFGGGLLVAKGLQDPLAKLLPAFGGQQIQRTFQGLDAYNQGYSESRTGKVRFPVEQNAQNLVQSGLFGQYSTPEARDYFKEERNVLGDKQSATFNSLPEEEQKAYYDRIMFQRKLDNFNEAIKEAMKNKKVSRAEELVKQKKAFVEEYQGKQQKSLNPFF